MLKKMMLLSTALAALMALVVPAMASASGGAIVDTVNGKTAANDTSIPVTITFNFATELGGFNNCDAHATLTTTESPAGVQSGTGDLRNIEVTPHSCEGFGALGDCTVEEANVTQPIHVTVTGHDLDIGELRVDGVNNAECGDLLGVPGLLADLDLDFPSVTVTPQAGTNTSLETATISSPEGGTATIINAGSSAAAEASGEVHLLEKGTWAIETVN